MKIFVDKLPTRPETCPFCIRPSLYDEEMNNFYAPNCKLMIDAGSGWTDMTFSATQNRYNCMFHFGKPCSFLTILPTGDK